MMIGRTVRAVRPSSRSPERADTKEGIDIMKSRITKRIGLLAILCVLITALASPALAASYSRVYGQTQARVRVRASASSSATILDNIIKGACVYVTSSKTSGGSTYVKVNYRNSDGDIDSGWVCQNDGDETYVKILSASQAKDAFSVKSGNLPSKKVGTFTTAERERAAGSSSSSSSSGDTDTIKSVQTMLKELGYYTAEITGNVGEKTEAAIRKFQREYDLSVDGVAGPKTIAMLEDVYTDKRGSSSSSTSSSSSGSTLKLGSTGTSVRNLQQNLTTLGYYWAEVTGHYGEKTEAAVKNFQDKNGLTVDGKAGKKTIAAIEEAVERKGGTVASSTTGTTLRLNSQGTAVSNLQTDLKQLGYYYASITGNFGEKTEAAVKSFQEDHGLSVDGVAGRKTLAAIADEIEDAGGSTSSSSGGLKVGSTGEKVTALQQDLTALGYYYGDITGHYGNLTKIAVKKFQKAKGITADGIAGTTTLNAIASALGIGSSSGTKTALREGDSGSGVLELQTMLKELDYYYGDLTGSFGSLTKRAVRKFQDDNDLTVDGVAGSKTLSLLRSKTGRTSSDSSSNISGSVTSSSVPKEDSYFEINQDGVRLRTTYSLSSAAKTTMNEGKAVQATRKYIVAGTTWYYITVKNSSGTYSGYVRARVLDQITEAEYLASGDAVSSDDVGFSGEILGMIRITGNDVHIREAADSDSTSVGKANKGDVFFYMKKSGNWYQLQSGYWVKNTYAEVLDEDEVDDYLSESYAGESYDLNDTGAMVTWIQESLEELGYYKGEVTGKYGRLTKEAVRQFQKAYELGADGIAGAKTIAKIMEEINKEYAEGAGDAVYNSTIYNIDWVANKSRIISGSGTYKLTDIATGRTFSIKIQSAGNHADVEPLTADDTKVLCSLYGVANSAQLKTDNKWQRRAVVMTNGNGEQFVGSIYAIPHGRNTISGNDFDGQFCVHFRGSTIHAGDGGSVTPSENHQAKIATGVKALRSAGYNVQE